MDQFTKGINMLIPHAVWYDNTKVTYKPELSHRNPLYADSLKIYTRFLARLNVLLQSKGRSLYYFANLGRNSINTQVTLRSEVRLEKWDRHSGESKKIRLGINNNTKSKSYLTKVELHLEPFRSVFWIEKVSK